MVDVLIQPVRLPACTCVQVPLRLKIFTFVLRFNRLDDEKREPGPFLNEVLDAVTTPGRLISLTSSVLAQPVWLPERTWVQDPDAPSISTFTLGFKFRITPEFAAGRPLMAVEPIVAPKLRALLIEADLTQPASLPARICIQSPSVPKMAT